MRGVGDEDDVGGLDVFDGARAGFAYERTGCDGGEGSSVGAAGDFGPQ